LTVKELAEMTDFEKYLRDYFPFELPVSALSADWLGLAAILKEAALLISCGMAEQGSPYDFYRV